MDEHATLTLDGAIEAFADAFADGYFWAALGYARIAWNRHDPDDGVPYWDEGA